MLLTQDRQDTQRYGAALESLPPGSTTRCGRELRLRLLQGVGAKTWKAQVGAVL